MYIREMVVTHPNLGKAVNTSLIHCIDQCHSCAQACTACADACLGEDEVKDLVDCIRINLDCADLCYATGRIATRRAGYTDGAITLALKACAAACALCAEACERHADRLEHCSVCAIQCQACEEACLEALEDMRAQSRQVRTH